MGRLNFARSACGRISNRAANYMAALMPSCAVEQAAVVARASIHIGECFTLCALVLACPFSCAGGAVGPHSPLLWGLILLSRRPNRHAWQPRLRLRFAGLSCQGCAWPSSRCAKLPPRHSLSALIRYPQHAPLAALSTLAVPVPAGPCLPAAMTRTTMVKLLVLACLRPAPTWAPAIGRSPFSTATLMSTAATASGASHCVTQLSRS